MNSAVACSATSAVCQTPGSLIAYSPALMVADRCVPPIVAQTYRARPSSGAQETSAALSEVRLTSTRRAAMAQISRATITKGSIISKAVSLLLVKYA